MKNSKRIVSKIQKNVQKEIVSVSKNRERKWQLVNFCEFDKYATKSYCAIHNVDESLNLGDITKVDETKLKSFNMICGG
jgi:site-specific DNA-cytosine methylase